MASRRLGSLGCLRRVSPLIHCHGEQITSADKQRDIEIRQHSASDIGEQSEMALYRLTEQQDVQLHGYLKIKQCTEWLGGLQRPQPLRGQRLSLQPAVDKDITDKRHHGFVGEGLVVKHIYNHSSICPGCRLPTQLRTTHSGTC